jgi:hypothetical protein
MALSFGTIFLACLPILMATGEASMNEQTILGKPADSRIARCGIVVEGGEVATVRPFMEASADLAGHFRIDLTKRSKSGTGMISQSNAFRGGKLSGALSVDRPAHVTVKMTVSAEDGSVLCTLDRQFDLGEAGIKI